MDGAGADVVCVAARQGRTTAQRTTAATWRRLR
jgi:hypothetical protein